MAHVGVQRFGPGDGEEHGAKSEEAELAYNSVLGFYTLKGVEFGRKPMTGTHMGVSPNFPLIR